MKTIKNEVINEIVINKSQFIAYLVEVKNEEEAKEILDNIKTKYKDATHYCYAYIIDDIKRFNDDGEPSGTAGMPIMEVLVKNDLNYIICVVIRYFGGIKLGAGGLVRAYAKSVREVLKKTQFLSLVEAKQITIEFDYGQTKVVDNILQKNEVINKKYENKVIYSVNIQSSDFKEVEAKLKLVDTLKVNAEKDIIIAIDKCYNDYK